MSGPTGVLGVGGSFGNPIPGIRWGFWPRHGGADHRHLDRRRNWRRSLADARQPDVRAGLVGPDDDRQRARTGRGDMSGFWNVGARPCQPAGPGHGAEGGLTTAVPPTGKCRGVVDSELDCLLGFIHLCKAAHRSALKDRTTATCRPPRAAQTLRSAESRSRSCSRSIAKRGKSHPTQPTPRRTAQHQKFPWLWFLRPKSYFDDELRESVLANPPLSASLPIPSSQSLSGRFAERPILSAIG